MATDDAGTLICLPPSIEVVLDTPADVDSRFENPPTSADYFQWEYEQLKDGDLAGALEHVKKLDEHLSKKRYHQAFMAMDQYITSLEFATVWERRGEEAKMLFMIALAKPVMMKLNPTSLLTLLKHIVDANPGLTSMKFVRIWYPCLKESQASLIMYKSILAYQLLDLNKLVECEELLFDHIEKHVESNYGLPSTVEAEFHRAAATYYWRKGNYDAFYQHGMYYLEGRDPERARESDDIILAKQLCRVVLLSPTIYSFTELMQHPILTCISPGGSAYPTHSFMRDLVVMCNSGDLPMFESFIEDKKNQIEKENLTEFLPVLLSKITIFALLEMAFLKPQKERTLTFDDIVQACKVPFDDVERLVMKVMSHGLMKGAIDGVNKTVTFWNLQPRLLDDHKIRPMADQFASWSTQISNVVSSVEKMIPNLESFVGNSNNSTAAKGEAIESKC